MPDLATRYLNHGRFESLPVFAFFDADWNEVGVFIERPVAVTERREEDRRAVYATDSGVRHRPTRRRASCPTTSAPA